MPSKLVKANQDKESNLPRVSICPLYQVPNYEHTHTYTHTHTHTGTHTQTETHTQEHTYTNTHRNTHTKEHALIWMGRAAITEEPEEQGLGL